MADIVLFKSGIVIDKSQEEDLPLSDDGIFGTGLEDLLKAIKEKGKK